MKIFQRCPNFIQPAADERIASPYSAIKYIAGGQLAQTHLRQQALNADVAKVQVELKTSENYGKYLICRVGLRYSLRNGQTLLARKNSKRNDP